jgi:dTMP kinase
MIHDASQRGRLISLEGIDGCGNSTLSRALATALQERGYEVVLTKEPGGSQLGKQLRAILQQQSVVSHAEFLLFAADRAQHLEEIVIPALQSGAFVISDRMADSSYAYQGWGRGIDKDFITHVNRWVMNQREPDITFYLEIDIDTAFKRINLRREKLTAFETQQRDFFERVIAGFNELRTKHNRIYTLDARKAQTVLLQDALDLIHKKLLA